MKHHTRLSEKIMVISRTYQKGLLICPRRTKKPIIIGMIGLVGSGKSIIAKSLAKELRATHIDVDHIRGLLRKHHEPYDHVESIVLESAQSIIEQGGNVIIDSDFSDATKRAHLAQRARRLCASLLYIQTTAHPDIMIGRTFQYLLAPSHAKGVVGDADSFFAEASSSWNGSPQLKQGIVKIREMWRRTPRHYRWADRNGGVWELKKLSFKPFATIDTSDAKKCVREIKHIVHLMQRTNRKVT